MVLMLLSTAMRLALERVTRWDDSRRERSRLLMEVGEARLAF